MFGSIAIHIIFFVNMRKIKVALMALIIIIFHEKRGFTIRPNAHLRLEIKQVEVVSRTSSPSETWHVWKRRPFRVKRLLSSTLSREDSEATLRQEEFHHLLIKVKPWSHCQASSNASHASHPLGGAFFCCCEVDSGKKGNKVTWNNVLQSFSGAANKMTKSLSGFLLKVWAF